MTERIEAKISVEDEKASIDSESEIIESSKNDELMKEGTQSIPQIDYSDFREESQLLSVKGLIDRELSEPYSIYTYRYFIYTWPHLCFFARHGDKYVGVIVCKLEPHGGLKRGYIAMLAVDGAYRRLKIGTTLTEKAIDTMVLGEADEIVLETELTNRPALRLYDSLGFIREKRLKRYYLNGADALRLKLFLKEPIYEEEDVD
ncbi:N-alpha-acetyltransferase 30A [Scaptodrosophila lebanonensis]|uniref:N-alpha-acetyltransferase 30A n=1 Tax=Drosophila lebanonensis TaxID=7225 RepID=A0A6J2TZP7_DROLE|nr:N-alpha-acetyltransferase 30A [Scaptodrosophila lebanonensis]